MTTVKTTGKYRNIKLRTRDSEECTAVQKMLFADGVRWVSGGTDVIHLGGSSTVLFISPEGTMTHSSSMAPARGQNMGCVEVEVEFERTLVAKLKDRPKTVLFGKTYYTDELNARLEGLKAC